MNIPQLKAIEMAIRHPGDHVSFPPEPGESPSSHRRRMESWAVLKMLRGHNADMPLPETGLEPKPYIRNQQTNTMNENNGAAPAQEVPKDDLMAMLAHLQKMVAELSKRKGGRPKGAKNKGSKPKYVNPFPGFQFRGKIKNRGGIGSVVEAIRHEQRLPSAIVAQRGGFHKGFMPMIESKGDIDLGIKYLAKVAKGLGMKGSELLAKLEEQQAQA